MNNSRFIVSTISLAAMVLALGACGGKSGTLSPADQESLEHVLASSNLALPSSEYNIVGIAPSGSAPADGGIGGYALYSSDVGTSVAYQGITFDFAPAGKPNALANKTIQISGATKSAYLYILATGISGAHVSEPFVVGYAGGTTATLKVSISDWQTWSKFGGETIAKSVARRVSPTGALQEGPFNIYGYTLNIDDAKVVTSLTLPPTVSVVVFGVALSSVSTPVTGGGGGGSTSSTGAPPQASAAHYTSLKFNESFSSTTLSTIDLKNTMNPKLGFNWYLSSDIAPTTAVSTLAHKVIDGVSTLEMLPGKTNTSTQNTAIYGLLPRSKSVTGKMGGHGFGMGTNSDGTPGNGGFYVEARLAMGMPIANASQWPCFWILQTLDGQTKWANLASSATSHNVEIDIAELEPSSPAKLGSTLLDWFGIQNVTCLPHYCDVNSQIVGYPAHALDNTVPGLKIASTTSSPIFNNWGALFVPKSSSNPEGYVQFYVNNHAFGTRTSWSSLPTSAPPTTAADVTAFKASSGRFAGQRFGQVQMANYGIILQTGGEAFMDVQYVHVWQE